MSSPESRLRENGCELEPYTNWPLILGSVGFVVVGIVTVGILMSRQPAIKTKPTMARVERPVRPVPGEQAAGPRMRLALPIAVKKQEQDDLPFRAEAIDHYEALGKPRIELPPGDTRRAWPVVSGPEAQTEAELLASLLIGSQEIDIESKRDTGKVLILEAEARNKSFHDSIREEARIATQNPLPAHIRAMNAKEAAFLKDQDVDGDNNYWAISKLIGSRSDLRGLPLQSLEKSTLSSGHARILGLVSVSTREARQRASFDSLRRGSTASVHLPLPSVLTLNRPAKEDGTWAFAEPGRPDETPGDYIRSFQQLYQVEPETHRLDLLRLLGKVGGVASSEAIAHFAVFDLSEKVRAAARKQLSARRADEPRPYLLKALRYPWAPAADHAAQALVETNDTKAIPDLMKLVELPDPNEPFSGTGGWYVREVVRLNHMKNCLLCHPPALTWGRHLIHSIPARDESASEGEYASRNNIGSISAGTVYLRQDFSVMQPTRLSKDRPKIQRFDYLVRTRRLSTEERRSSSKEKTRSYPQRDAVQYAIWSLKDPTCP